MGLVEVSVFYASLFIHALRFSVSQFGNNLVPRAFPLKVGGASHLQGKSPGNEVEFGKSKYLGVTKKTVSLAFFQSRALAIDYPHS